MGKAAAKYEVLLIPTPSNFYKYLQFDIYNIFDLLGMGLINPPTNIINIFKLYDIQEKFGTKYIQNYVVWYFWMIVKAKGIVN